MGTTLPGDNVFACDLLAWRRQGIVSDPNIAVLGKIGQGKSTVFKSMATRLGVLGYESYFTDFKPEYSSVIELLGGQRVHFRPGGGGSVVNPLDAGLRRGTTPEDIEQARISYLYAIVEAAGLDSSRRRLTPPEQVGIATAVREAARMAPDGAPTLAQVMDVALQPTPAMALDAHASIEQLAGEMRVAACALQRLVTADLRGMFDGQTNVRIDSPFVSFDLSDLADSDALPVAMVTISAWLEQLFRRSEVRPRLLFFDEAWQAIAIPSVVRWLNRAFRLSRTWGVCCCLAIHSPRDFGSMSAEGSEAQQIAKSLLQLTSTRVIFNLDQQDAVAAQRLLGLSDAQVDIITTLPQYHALWMVGQRSFVVRHLLTDIEKEVFDTNQAMAAIPKEVLRLSVLQGVSPAVVAAGAGTHGAVAPLPVS